MEGKPLIRPSKGSTDAASMIATLHERLDLHFRELATRRQLLPGEPRVYAIEHGLSPGDLSVLRDVVESWISRSRTPRQHWLPFVVYATEIGYRYEGDEYWPTLETNAPGWERHVGRHYVKARISTIRRGLPRCEPRWPMGIPLHDHLLANHPCNSPYGPSTPVRPALVRVSREPLRASCSAMLAGLDEYLRLEPKARRSASSNSLRTPISLGMLRRLY